MSTPVITEFPANALLAEEKFLYPEHTLSLFMGDSVIHSFIHFVVCLMTGPCPLPKPVLHMCDLVLLP
jgi:hypothetical protein